MPEQDDHLVDGRYAIKDLVDLDRLRKIFEMFTKSTGFTIGFLDHPGLNILIATGWRDICTKHHRLCPVAAQNCLKSNKHLLDQLTESGKTVVEECENGLVDCAMPIIIKGKHIASLATGQMLLKAPDIERFRQQARTFGIEEKQYLEALKEIPVVSEEKLRSITGFLGEIALMISEFGYANLEGKEEAIRLEQEIAERKRVEQALRFSEERYKTVFDGVRDAIFVADPQTGVLIDCNKSAQELIGRTKAEILSMSAGQLHPEETVSEAMALFKRLVSGEDLIVETFVLAKDGQKISVAISAAIMEIQGKRCLVGIFRDITERKKAEVELRESESRLDFALQTIHTGAWELDLLNHTAHRTLLHDHIFGYATLLSSWTYEMFLEHVLPEDRPDVDRSFREATAAQSDWNFECRIRRADGEIRWIWAAGGHQRNLEGKLLRMSGIVQDITERKKTEMALAFQRTFLAAMLENVDAGVVACNGKGELVLFNRAARDWHGMDPMNIPQSEWARYYDLYLEDGVTPMEVNIVPLVRAFRGERVHDVSMVIAAKGQPKRDILAHASPVKRENGQVLGAVAVMHDITERKKAEGELRQYRERLEELIRVRTAELTQTNERLMNAIEEHEKAETALEDARSYLDKIINSLADPIFVKDREHRWVLLNDVFCDFMGKKREELLGKSDYHFFPKSEADVFWAKDEEVFNAGRENLNEEFFTDGKGVVRTIMTKKALYTDKAGNRFIVGIIRDISEIKRATEQLVAAQARMVHAEKMASLGQFVAGIAHEINNPAGYVLANLDILKQYEANLEEYFKAVVNSGFADSSPLKELAARLKMADILKDCPNIVAETIEGAERIKKIVQDLRVFAHPERGNWEYKDLHHVLESALTIIGAEVKERAEVVKHYGMIPLVRIKEQQMVQVFINLLANAAQAIEGHGTVTIKTLVRGKHVSVEITDTGEGISQENLSRVFDPFYTTKPVGKGTGLGLSVVHSIIEQHKGTITVHSNPGEGATFIVKLPVEGGGREFEE
ncbi:MAG: PAS domain S-box protein [Candidatus Omnitrophica bacterium]|nr:PAS domain S-box protein [Candidatus Omnitrophota bacterium]